MHVTARPAPFCIFLARKKERKNMALSWRDAATTALAAGASLVAYAKYQNWQGWFTSTRISCLALGVIGIVMCATGASSIPSGSAWSAVLTAMGIVALPLIIAGVITGSSLILYALAADILALWLLTTLRHLVGAA